MLRDEQGRAARRERAQGLADQSRPFRVQLGGQLVEHEMWRPHRQQRRDHHELALAARQAARFAVPRWSMPRVARAAFVRSTVSRWVSPVHRPQGDLLEDRAGHAGQLGRRVLEPDPDPRRELVERLVRPSPRRRSRGRPGQRAADRARRQARRHQAQRRLAGLVGADDADDLAVGEGQVDVVEDGLGVARVAVRDPGEDEHRGSDPAGDPRGRGGHQQTDERPSEDPLPASSGIAHRRWRRPGRLNARDSSARLRSSTSVSDPMITGPTIGRRPRTRARMLPSVSRPRARWLSLIIVARSTSVGTASIVATAMNAARGGTPRRSRSKTKARGSVVMMKSPIDSEIAKRRTSVWSAKSTPSTVASNGPIWKRTVVPARVKTLTSTTEMAIGSVSSTDTRARRTTPAPQRAAASAR